MHSISWRTHAQMQSNPTPGGRTHKGAHGDIVARARPRRQQQVQHRAQLRVDVGAACARTKTMVPENDTRVRSQAERKITCRVPMDITNMHL